MAASYTTTTNKLKITELDFDAIKEIQNYLCRTDHGVILDIDLSNFFGTIDHRKLIQILELKIKDRTFIRYIVRMLKSGILSD